MTPGCTDAQFSFLMVPSCPCLRHASVSDSCNPSTDTLLSTLFISLCPHLAQHVWIPTVRKGRIQTLKPLEKVQVWPVAFSQMQAPSPPAPCAEPSARHHIHSHRRLTSFVLPGTTVRASELRVLKHRGILNKMFESGVVHLFYKIVCFRNFFNNRLTYDT